MNGGSGGRHDFAKNPTIDIKNVAIYVSFHKLLTKIVECVVNHNDSGIVCITETWLFNEIPDNAVAMNGFTLFRKDLGKRGGDVAIPPNQRLVVPDLSECVSEILWLQIRPGCLLRVLSSILIAVVYHPPHASADGNYKLHDYIQDVVHSYSAGHPDSLICIVGDFNPNSTSISSNLFRQLCGLTMIVETFTRDSDFLD